MLHFGRWKLITILATLLIGVLYTIPNLVPYEERYAEDLSGEPVSQGIWSVLPSRTINLGLDLQGGSHLVFQVDMDKVRVDQLDALRDDARQAMRIDPPILTRPPAVVGDEVIITAARPEDRDAVFQRITDLSGPVSTQAGQISLDQTLDVVRDPDDERVVRASITNAYFQSIRTRTVVQSIEVIRKRLDGMGTVDPTIARQGEERVLVQVPGADNPARIRELVESQASMSFHMVDTSIDPGPNGDARMPPGRVVHRMANSNPACYLVVESRTRLTGENLTNSNVTTHPSYVGPVVGFRFDTQGAIVFGELTRNNRGQQFAIVLDDEIISAPRINEPILGGSGIIGGGYTYETAQDLVVLLNAGALPASLTAVEERTVRASLGADQIASGQKAIIIGFAAVIIFMLAAYGVFGVFSTVALLANVILILGALSGLGATLTLSGIAGIILTIGMAVDANVLIYERIREESRVGRTPANAIQAGYERALVAILDANITTFIAAAVLFMMGAGPVRGFAVTLGIGIITSVFTAFVFSRLLAVLWLRAFKPKTLPL